jgi:hypothetical protein
MVWNSKSRRSDKTVTPSVNTSEEESPSVYDWDKHLNDLAAAQEEDIRKEFPERHRKFVELDDAQLKGFSFNCRRFGDFLTIEIARVANDLGKGFICTNQKIAKTLNLAKINTIQLSVGHGVDYGGTLHFYAQQRKGDVDLPCNDFVNGVQYLSPPEDGFEYVPIPAHSHFQTNRSILIERDPSSSHGFYYDDLKGSVDFSIDNYPRASEDDRIILNGLCIEIPVPFGMGQMILDQILSELERGSNQDPIVIRSIGSFKEYHNK